MQSWSVVKERVPLQPDGYGLSATTDAAIANGLAAATDVLPVTAELQTLLINLSFNNYCHFRVPTGLGLELAMLS